MKHRFIILICLLLEGFVMSEAQTPHSLRVQRHKQGFTITKAVDGEDVLLAYSETGDFDKAMNDEPLFRKVMDTFGKVSRRMPVRINANDLPDEAKPLCTDLWTQDEPYHNLTPIIDSTHCKTGCVATAMTQVMYYYKYPLQGMGSHTYFDMKGCKDTLSADFSAHTYDWDYMLDTYEGINYSERQAQAVALLSSDCGISVEMQYGVEASGAETIMQPYALYNYFGYDPGMRMIYRDFYHRDELHQLIRTELAAGHPVTCSAHGVDGGGHAFVIDGYDRDGLYHINWGWGGWCNGYYNIDYMNPDQPEWEHHPDRIENGMNILQGFVLGIQPLGATPNPEVHEYAFSHLELINDSALVVHNLCNVGWNAHEGRVVLAITDIDNDNVVGIAYDYNRKFVLEEFIDYTYTDTIAFADMAPQFAPLADATYRLMPMFEDNGEWKHARTSCGTPYYIYIDKQGETVSPREAQGATGNLQLVGIECPDTVIRREYAPMSITLSNSSDDEYCGRIYLCQESSPTSSDLKMLTRFGLYLSPHSTQTIDLNYIYISSRLGDMLRLHVLYDVDLFTDSLVHFDNVKEVMVADQPSGIHTLTQSFTQEEELYNLQGQRTNALQPGVNITRKRKLYIK